MKKTRKLIPLLSLVLAAALLAACGGGSAAAPFDAGALELSEYGEDGIVDDVVDIRLDGDPAKSEEVALTYANLTAQDFTYTAVQRLEVLLDGIWYVVPDKQDFVTMQLLTLPAGASVEDTFRLEGRYDPLPAGSYRIVKSFTNFDGLSTAAAVEFAVK